jgi:hypothetical protein
MPRFRQPKYKKALKLKPPVEKPGKHIEILIKETN